MKKYLVAILIIIVLFFILGFLPEPQNKTGNIYKTTTVSVGETQVLTEIADTNALRTLGLSGRESFEEGKGMLFVFDSAGHHGFWMKNMKFSIDIIWADENKIVFIEESVSPTTFPKVFSPTAPARFVLEVPAGFVSSHQLKVGDFFSTGL